MMKRLFIFPLLLVLLVAACGSSSEPKAAEQPASGDASGPVVTVYRAPT